MEGTFLLSRDLCGALTSRKRLLASLQDLTSTPTYHNTGLELTLHTEMPHFPGRSLNRLLGRLETQLEQMGYDVDSLIGNWQGGDRDAAKYVKQVMVAVILNDPELVWEVLSS